MDSNLELQEKISETFFYFIHSVPRLKCLFQQWCVLNPENRRRIDEEILAVLGYGSQFLYKPLRDAFVRWELVQDKEGAPGFYPGANEYECNNKMESEIMKILNAFESTLEKVNNDKVLEIRDDLIIGYRHNIKNRIQRSKSIGNLAEDPYQKWN